MTTRRRVVIGAMILVVLAAAAWSYRRYRTRGWPPPENTGGWAGPLTRPSPGYNPSKPPSRPWLIPPREVPAHTTYHTYAASTINGQHTDYLLYLPPGYDDPANRDRRYPVIYWLHGFGSEPQHGSPFVEGLDAEIRAGRAPPAIVVLPNGLFHSWYCDSVDGSQPVESVIIKDLLPHIDKTWRTIPDRRARATEGFSMGGWGAAHLAVKYPDLFCAATLVSAPLHQHVSFPQLWPIFSNSREAYYAEDPITRLRRNAAELKGAVRIRILVGAKDWTAVFARNFDKRLTEWNIPHEFLVAPGAGHDTGDIYQALGPRAFAFYSIVFQAGQP